MTATRQTRLSVTFPVGDTESDYVFEVADTDVTTFAFDAEQAITGASAILMRLDRPDEDVSAAIVNEAVATPEFSVTLANLTRGLKYELSLVFVNSAGRLWTRTLTLHVVA